MKYNRFLLPFILLLLAFVFYFSFNFIFTSVTNKLLQQQIETSKNQAELISNILETRIEHGIPKDVIILEFQKSIEQKAWHLAGETQKVPAQRLVDFTEGKLSKNIPETSYKPGTSSIEMSSVLPDFIYKSLQDGFIQFGKAMKGYLTNDAVVHAPESRTSSPVRIPRDKMTLQHIEIEGLYPCGEGAGYAGGIISAAIDGEKCAREIISRK